MNDYDWYEFQNVPLPARFPDNGWLSGVQEWAAGVATLASGNMNKQSALRWLNRIRRAPPKPGSQSCPRVFVSHKQADADYALRAAWLSSKEGFDYWIESSYDGFAHETVVALKKMRVTCAASENSERVKGLCVSLQAALHCPGKQTDYVRRATIRLTFESKSWDRRHDADERDLSAVADGETIRLGRMAPLSREVNDGLASEDMRETLEASVPYAAFLKLSRASYVEFSVGKTTFALGDKNVAALRDMNNRVKLPPPATAGGN